LLFFENGEESLLPLEPENDQGSQRTERLIAILDDLPPTSSLTDLIQ
jgi:hypothetical protein